MEVDGIPVDGLSGLQTRMSMQARRSGDLGHRRSDSWSLRSPGGLHSGRRKPSGDQQHLMHSYDIEASGLSELAEDSDEDTSGSSGKKRTSFENGEGSAFGPPRRVQTDKVRMGGKSFDRPKR